MLVTHMFTGVIMINHARPSSVDPAFSVQMLIMCKEYHFTSTLYKLPYYGASKKITRTQSKCRVKMYKYIFHIHLYMEANFLPLAQQLPNLIICSQIAQSVLKHNQIMGH